MRVSDEQNETMVRETEQTGYSISSPVTLSVLLDLRGAETAPVDLLNAIDAAHDIGACEIVILSFGADTPQTRAVHGWQQTANVPVTVVHSDEAQVGLLSHVPRLLPHARGEWVTAPSPRSVPQAGYFARIIEAAGQHSGESMLVCRRFETTATGDLVSASLDQGCFEEGYGSGVDLLSTPELFHLSAETTVWHRAALVEQMGAEGREIAAGAEEVALISGFLLQNGAKYETVRGAELIVPRNKVKSVLARHGNTCLADQVRTIVDGYLPVAQRLEGTYPQWFANVLLISLALIFADERKLHSELDVLSEEEIGSFSRAARQLLSGIGEEGITAFNLREVHPETRMAWVAATGEITRSPVALLETDLVRDRQRAAFYAGLDSIDFTVTDAPGTRVVGKKIRAVEYFEELWCYEHIVVLEGKNAHEARFVSETEGFDFAGGELLPVKPPKAGGRKRLGRLQRRIYALALRLAQVSGYARRYRSAWVLADRREQANDNAEVLYRHIMHGRPDINAWFVLGKHVPAYSELKREGFRMVPYGSLRHFVLMKHAKHLVCSQIDQTSMLPFSPRVLSRTWRFTYLKHGVLHTAHYRRYNAKRIDLVVSATSQEDSDLTRDGGGYRFTREEVALTGMPRHDRLMQAKTRAESKGKSPDLLLIMPTWRIYLGRKNSDLTWSVVDGFENTAFVQQWSAFLNSPDLRRTCEEQNMRAVFLMHPRFAPHSAYFNVPEWMQTATYQEDIAGLIAATRLAVTDFSSQAFEAAFVGAPTVYFQFDYDEFFAGGHSSQAGEYVHDRDGFGPVAPTVPEAVHAVEQMVTGTHPRREEYAERIEKLYAFRDGDACARTVLTIEERLD